MRYKISMDVTILGHDRVLEQIKMFNDNCRGYLINTEEDDSEKQLFTLYTFPTKIGFIDVEFDIEWDNDKVIEYLNSYAELNSHADFVRIEYNHKMGRKRMIIGNAKMIFLL